MPDFIQSLAFWVSRTSWQAITLVGLVLLIQGLLGSRLPARWRHAIWWVVILKLLLPIHLYTPFSLFNLPALNPPTGWTRELSRTWWLALWPWVWLLGALLTLGLILREHRRLSRAVVRQRPVTDPSVLDLLEDCKSLMRVHAPLAVIETPKVSSPALFGLLRPRLLLPRGILRSLSPLELRHVFLHELAHLQRHDIAFGWLLALAQSVHWFNPFIWLALHRARIDRELATDELALHYADLHENRAYAETIIKLLEHFSSPTPLPALAGILEDQRQISCRIRHIAQFGSIRNRPLLAAGLGLLLALTGLTQGRPQSQLVLPSPTPVSDSRAVPHVPPGPGSRGTSTFATENQRRHSACTISARLAAPTSDSGRVSAG
jgi:bla regulator protein blaR1